MAAELLADPTIKAAEPGPKSISLPDGNGLSLLITPDGTKSWRFRYRRPDTGSNNEMAIGRYPLVTLKQARAKLVELRSLVANGMDAAKEKKAKRKVAREAMKSSRAAAADSFKALADAFLYSQPEWTR